MTPITKELDFYIQKLTDDEKSQLALALKNQLLLAEAKRLSSFKVRNPISVQEIIKEIRLVRKKK